MQTSQTVWRRRSSFIVLKEYRQAGRQAGRRAGGTAGRRAGGQRQAGIDADPTSAQHWSNASCLLGMCLCVSVAHVGPVVDWRICWPRGLEVLVAAGFGSNGITEPLVILVRYNYPIVRRWPAENWQEPVFFLSNLRAHCCSRQNKAIFNQAKVIMRRHSWSNADATLKAAFRVDHRLFQRFLQAGKIIKTQSTLFWHWPASINFVIRKTSGCCEPHQDIEIRTGNYITTEIRLKQIFSNEFLFMVLLTLLYM